MAFAYPPSIARTKVIWIRRPPGHSDLEFRKRQLQVAGVTITEALGHMSTACGIVIAFDAKRPGAFSDELRTVGVMALDYGLQVHIVTNVDRDQLHIAHVVNQLGLGTVVCKHTAPDDSDLAEQIARHSPGPPAANVDIRGRSVDPQTSLLLRRAFSDCSRLLLGNLPGGMTSDVMSVHAVFQASLSGPRPLPFFAKLCDRKAFDNELYVYRHYVDHFIPFNLRPNLDYDRCVCGCSHGILVGNFVENSEPMTNAAVRGTAQAAIHSLFDSALRGWRLQAKFKTANLHSELKSFFRKDQIPLTVVQKAHKRGAKHDADQIEKILTSMSATKHLSGPTHGDLHSRTVCVRGDDAILIDFQCVDQRPILADRACLEISLAFEEIEHDSNVGWYALIDTVFNRKYFLRPPPPALEPAPREWMWNCVRQVRSIALGDETARREYQATMAICLLRHARLPRRPTDTAVADERKVYAYVIADRLLSDFE